MTLPDLIRLHLVDCDELHQLTLEENRFLKREQRPPDQASRERKQALSHRWSESLNRLKAYPRQPDDRGGEALEQARQRCLQILHLDRENEQLLLRCSLGTPSATISPPTLPTDALKAYGAASTGVS